jgi:porphobilinogen synthase
MAFPLTRMRRLRATGALRELVRETRVVPAALIAPLFVAGEGGPISTMPGVARLSVADAVAETARLAQLGVGGVLLFGVPDEKSEDGRGAWDEQGYVQQAVRAIKAAHPQLVVITDVCMCEYTSHGHCGVLTATGQVDNDATLPLLARVAVSHAQAGADIVAPSDMMDGRIGALRTALDEAGFPMTPIMAYSTKFASAFYGPFREAADSTPAFGDRRGYQMDPANGREAVRETLIDEQEGADIVMVKPALAYLDVVAAIRAATALPLCVYNVSGEYSMVKAAAQAGYIDERAVVLETLTAFARAGADMIITYHAADAARWLA